MHRSISHAPSNPTCGRSLALAALLVLVLVVPSQAGGTQLYGVHWWDYDHPTAGDGPTGGWSVETVVTDSAPWW